MLTAPPLMPATRLRMMLMPPLPVFPLLLRSKPAVLNMRTMAVKQPFVVVAQFRASPGMIVVIIRVVGGIAYGIVTRAPAESGQGSANKRGSDCTFPQHTPKAAIRAPANRFFRRAEPSQRTGS